METRYISSMKKAYSDLLLENGDEERAAEVATSETYTPIMKIREAHPEQEPEPKDFNTMLNEVVYDTSILKVEYASMGYAFKELMSGTVQRLKSVQKDLEAEKERQQDINLLCNRYTEFGQVITLSSDDFEGGLPGSDGAFCAAVEDSKEVAFEVVTVEGNGYEGNKYVYKNEAFLEETINTANRKYINDGSDIPLYEYSRITASNLETDVFPLVNFDSVEAQCSITIHSNTKINNLRIDSPSKDTILANLFVSDDGIQFRSVIDEPIEFNNSDKKYELPNYVPGSGVVAFPSSNYVRVVLRSNGVTDDVIAFSKTDIASATGPVVSAPIDIVLPTT